MEHSCRSSKSAVVFVVAVFTCFIGIPTVYTKKVDDWTGTPPSPDPVTGLPQHFYPAGPDAGDTMLNPSDDGVTGPITTSQQIIYFDMLYDQLYINTNGLLSLDTAMATEYTPQTLPLLNSIMMAGYWADIDTRRNGGRIYYRQTTSDTALLTTLTNNVKSVFINKVNFKATWALIVTWYKVTYFGGASNSPVNTFQIAVVTDGNNCFTVYNYGDMTWTTGTASGGVQATGLNINENSTAALVGFNGGNDINFYTQPGSMTESIVNIYQGHNSGIIGRYMYRSDTQHIAEGGCTPSGELTVYPRFAGIFGGKEVTVTGPVFNPGDDIVARFGNTTIECHAVDMIKAHCVVPTYGHRGLIYVQMSTDGGKNYTHSGSFMYVDDDPTYRVERVNSAYWTFGNSSKMIRWDKTIFHDCSKVNVLFATSRTNENGTVEAKYSVLLQSVPNDGEATLPSRIKDEVLFFPFYGVVMVLCDEAVPSGVFVWSEIHDASWFMQMVLLEIFYRNTTGTPVIMDYAPDLTDGDSIGDGIHWEETCLDWMHILENLWEDIKKTHLNNLIKTQIKIYPGNVNEVVTLEKLQRWLSTGGARTLLEPLAVESCDAFEFIEFIYSVNSDKVTTPPCLLDQALYDPDFEPDPYCNIYTPGGCDNRPDAIHCIRAIAESSSGYGQLACYNSEGNLLPFERSGGLFHRADIRCEIPILSHFVVDRLPYYLCCEWSNKCDKYTLSRFPKNCEKYQPFAIASGFGDPHFYTFDGFKYSFNGIGEYELVNLNQGEFILQGRMQQATDQNGDLVSASRFTSFVMKASDSDVVQVDSNPRTLIRTYVNQVMVDEWDPNPLHYKNVDLIWNGTDSSVIVHMVMGVIVIITPIPTGGYLQFEAILPDRLQGKTTGMMGTFNKDNTDDLQLPDGTTLAASSTPQVIYNGFNKWRVPTTETLFFYGDGLTYQNYQNENFVPDFTIPVPDAAAIQKCNNIDECLFDLATTGDENVALATAQAVQLYQHDLQVAQYKASCGWFWLPHGIVNTTAIITGTVLSVDCETGYILTGADITECLDTNLWSNYTSWCEDIDECSTSHRCNVGSTCVNTDGSYTCDCPQGYAVGSDGITCNDEDECELQLFPCSNVGDCTNTEGSYDCDCNAGYMHINVTVSAEYIHGDCADVDECASTTPYICGELNTCTNAIGSYTCTCTTGFILSGDAKTCLDIDECASSDTNTCAGNTCANTPGAYECTCTEGFTSSTDGQTCQDNDECAGDNPCKDPNTCTNAVGSYQCQCGSGYVLNTATANKPTCSDVNECSQGTPCGPAINSCSNTVGSYTCTCGLGYSLTDTANACHDIDECEQTDRCGSGALCENSQGSYDCTCQPGYDETIDGNNNKICRDKDECSGNDNPCGVSITCTNQSPFYTCGCPAGTNAVHQQGPTCSVTGQFKMDMTFLVVTSLSIWNTLSDITNYQTTIFSMGLAADITQIIGSPNNFIRVIIDKYFNTSSAGFDVRYTAVFSQDLSYREISIITWYFAEMAKAVSLGTEQQKYQQSGTMYLIVPDKAGNSIRVPIEGDVCYLYDAVDECGGTDICVIDDNGDPECQSKANPNKILGIVFGVIAFLILLTALVICVIMSNRKRRERKRRRLEREMAVSDRGSLSKDNDLGLGKYSYFSRGSPWWGLGGPTHWQATPYQYR